MGITVTFKPEAGTSIVLNNDAYPVDEAFEVDVEFSDPAVKKMQRSGEWPTFGYPGAVSISLEGHILGTSKADYWTKRNAFLVALTPPPGEQTKRRHGIVTIADSDAAEPMFGDCRIVHRIAHLENLSPERGPFLVTFKVFETYLTGVASGRPYLIG
jgi:hypothetical protein